QRPAERRENFAGSRISGRTLQRWGPGSFALDAGAGGCGAFRPQGVPVMGPARLLAWRRLEPRDTPRWRGKRSTYRMRSNSWRAPGRRIAGAVLPFANPLVSLQSRSV